MTTHPGDPFAAGPHGTPEGQALPAIFNAEGIVSDDLPCRSCGYNLRGLSHDGQCPECGTAVMESARGDLLRHADPGWLGKLRTGTRLILWGIVGLILTMIFIGALAAGGTGMSTEVLALVIEGGFSVMILAGTWMITEPDPSGRGEDRYGTSRKIIRAGVVVGLAVFLVDAIVSFVPLPPAATVGLQVLSALMSLFQLVALFALVDYLRKMYLRVPDQKLAARCRVVFWGLGISYGLLIFWGLLMMMLALTGGGMAAGAGLGVGVALPMCVIALAMIVFGLMFLGLLERFSKMLKEQIALATSANYRENQPA